MNINPLNLPAVTTALLEETLQAKMVNASWFLKIFDYCRTDLSTPFNDFPYLWDIKKSRIQSDFLEIIKEPDRAGFGQQNVPTYVLSIPLHDPSVEKITKIVRMIEQQSFGTTQEKSQTRAEKRIAIVIGLNTFRSLDKEHNSDFAQRIENLRVHSTATNISSYVSLTILPFIWRHGWALKRNFVNRQTFFVEKCYLIAKSYFNHLTKSTEPLWVCNDFSKNHRPQVGTIPYQFIRDTILHSRDLKQYMERVKSEARYILSLDSDFSSLKRPNKLGLLSRYNRLLREHKKLNGVYPDVVSTGYEHSLETTNIMIRAGLELDRYIRASMPAKLVYMPEPNFAFRIQNITDLKTLTWVGGGRGDMTTESRRLLAKGIEKRIFNPDHFVFSFYGPIQTEIDAEWFTKTVKKFAAITKDDLTKKAVQKALRGIHQSHADPQIWATNVYTGLRRTLRNYMKDGIAPIKGIRELFDPVTIKNGKYPDKVHNDLWCILNIYDQYAQMMRQVITLETSVAQAIDKFLNDHPIFSAREWRPFFETQIRCLQDYSSLLLQSYTPEETGLVISAAISTGKAIQIFYQEELLPPIDLLN